MNKKNENQKIQVFARCRPLNSIEHKQNSPSIVEVIPDKKEIVLKVGNTSREYTFDKVFPKNTKQIAVYKAVAGPLIKEVLMGYNCTVFAYGQTGTGKTYTMEGERNNVQSSWEEDPGAGIIPRSLHQLFEELNKEANVEFSLRVSFLELYNEKLYDLLSSTELSELRLYEDTNRKGSVIIHGLEEILVNNKDEVYGILEKGTARRKTAATQLNASSSRSHTVFSVTVHIKENTVEGEELLKTGKLNLVDLAGSENVGRSGAIDKLAREAGNINQSLLTLGRVITALMEKQPHVPYRESKLTRLLQDSLGGHTKTSIIATISPAQCNLDETLSTLDYATKAKSITIKPKVNQRMTKRALIKEYTEEIERLRKDLAALRNGEEGFYVNAENYNSMIERIEHLKAELAKLQEMFTTTKEELGKTQQQYIETEQKYSRTKEDLSYTKEVLSKTMLKRDENQYLVNYQKDKEKQLLLQTKKLVEVAEQTTNDVNKLHAKIEYKTDVEKTNEERWKNFRMQLKNRSTGLVNKISENANRKNSFFQSLEEISDQVQSDLKCHKEKTSSILDTLMEEQKSLLNDYSNQMNERSTDETQWTNDLLEDVNSKKDEFVAMYQKFVSQKLPSLLNKLNSQSADMEAWVLNTQKNIQEKVNQHVLSLEAQIAQDKSSLSSLRHNLESLRAKHNAEVLEYKKQIQSLYKEKENMAQLKTYLRNSLEICDDFEEQRNTSQMENNCSNFEKNLFEINASEEFVNELERGVNVREDVNTLISDIPAVAKLDEFNSIKDTTLQCNKSVTSEFGDCLKDVHKLQNDNYCKVKDALDHHKTYLQKSKQNLSSKPTISTSLSNTIEERRNCLAENVENLITVINHSKDISKHERTKNADQDTQLKSEILKYDLEIEKFYSEDLVKDIPTGATPQRKSFCYPREFDLATSSPADQVLHRFHSRLATLPDIYLSSNNNLNECLESTSSDGKSSNLLEVSSTSEISDGCESDSSITSDISTGCKNKENYTKRKCKSGLSKASKKCKGFLKPPQITRRQPLHSSNSDTNSTT